MIENKLIRFLPSDFGDMRVMEISFLGRLSDGERRVLGVLLEASSDCQTCLGGGALSFGRGGVGETGTDFGTLLLCARAFCSGRSQRMKY